MAFEPRVLAARAVEPHFSERHAIDIAASPAAVAAAVRNLDLSASPSVQLLMALRGMPRNCAGLDGLLRSRFFILEDDPARTLRLGLVGRFWTPGGGLLEMTPARFHGFDEPGYAKAVWSFDWSERDGVTRLVTETTVRCTDERSRRRFGLYWRFVKPFSGWIRKRALASIRADAEKTGTAGSA